MTDLIITTIKEGDRFTYPKKGSHVRIHFDAYVEKFNLFQEA